MTFPDFDLDAADLGGTLAWEETFFEVERCSQVSGSCEKITKNMRTFTARKHEEIQEKNDNPHTDDPLTDGSGMDCFVFRVEELCSKHIGHVVFGTISKMALVF